MPVLRLLFGVDGGGPDEWQKFRRHLPEHQLVGDFQFYLILYLAENPATKSVQCI